MKDQQQKIYILNNVLSNKAILRHTELVLMKNIRKFHIPFSQGCHLFGFPRIYPSSKGARGVPGRGFIYDPSFRLLTHVRTQNTRPKLCQRVTIYFFIDNMFCHRCMRFNVMKNGCIWRREYRSCVARLKFSSHLRHGASNRLVRFTHPSQRICVAGGYTCRRL